MELFLFHSLTQDPVVSALLSFGETGEEADYYRAARGLIAYGKKRMTSGNIIKEYILHAILENPNMNYITELRDFLREDVRTVFHELLAVDWDGLFRDKGLLPLSNISLAPREGELDTGYVRSLEMMMDCASNEALVGALLAHVEAF